MDDTFRDPHPPAGSGRASGAGPYFERLRERLASLTRDAIGAGVIEYARRLRSVEREALLACFPAAATVPTRSASSRSRKADAAAAEAAPAGARSRKHRQPPRPADRTLAADVDHFIEALKKGEYVEGWGWDPDIRDERAWGDESWAPEMDELLARADAAFFAGDRELARDAYGLLLRAFELERDGPTFCGPADPVDMLDADIGAVKARYFRCIYELEEKDARPVRLLLAAQQLASVGDAEVGMRAMADADADPLPDFDEFLDRWTATLEAATDGRPFGWSRLRRWLIREAALLSGGLAGLEALAQRAGADDPAVHDELMRALLRESRVHDALAAGRRGVEAVRDAHARARLADGVADLAAAHGDRELVAETTRTAWRTEPTPRRLRALCAGFDATPAALPALLADELEWLRDRIPRPANALVARVELLVGDLDSVARRLETAPILGWSGPGHPGRVAVSGLLAAAIGDRAPAPPGTVVARLWADLDVDSPWDSMIAWTAGGEEEEDDDFDEEVEDGFGEGFENTFGGGLEDGDGSAGGVTVGSGRGSLGFGGPEPSRYTELLAAVLALDPVRAEVRRRLLDRVATVVRTRVQAVVSAKHRGAYERVAHLAVACAEAYALAGAQAEARDLLGALRDEFRRFYAFRRELDAAVSGSAALGRGFVAART